MKDQNLNADAMKILEDAPSARKALRENYDNLLNVADYCCNNYIQAGEGSMKALEETKKFTTQSLASVAYQISTLASSVLNLLDAQTNQLRHLESSINLIGQTVEMHKEKVSRREIGAFTAVRRVTRSHKILPPTNTQPRPPYSRKPINYQQLDSLGHGMKKHATSFMLLSSSFGKPVAPPTIPTIAQAPPEADIITTLLDNAPPPPPAPNEVPAPDSEATLALPPPPPLPVASGDMLGAPPPPPPPPLSSVYPVRALYSYEAVKPDELSFTEGDIIYLTQRHDDGWFEGILSGKQGFFPENYVESCD
uniref:Osteoclast-stimulating factor 1 n=1 Tax=Amphilophus citrinellus TaxID=61819 RepID=A0A3Q0TFG6_AMPCI